MPTCQIMGENQNEAIVKMYHMKPLQVGRIVCNGNDMRNNHLVMRTASTEKFEVIDLSEYEEDACWTDPEASYNVKLLAPDEEVTITLKNN